MTRKTPERNVVSRLVLPVLEHVGYPLDSMIEEHQAGRRRLDVALWGANSPIGQVPPSVIVEVKALGMDFDHAASAAGTPQRQIETYMTSAASRPDVWGVLTDGSRWRILRRTGEHDVGLVGEWVLPGNAAAIEAVAKHIGHDVCDQTRPEPWVRPKQQPLLELLAGDSPPAEVLHALGVDSTAGPVQPHDAAAKLAEKNEWAATVWGLGPRIEQEQATLMQERIAVGHFRLEVRLARDDVHLAMKSLAAHSTAGVAVGAFVGVDGLACFAAHVGGRTSVGARFDPAWPDAYDIRSAERVAQRLGRDVVDWAAVDGLLSNHRLHQDFFADVRRWIAKRMAGKDHAGRTALLRHLLRCVFAWAMRERAGMSDRLFESGWWASAGGESYHRDVVRFLFHKRLNRPAANRGRHDIPAIEAAMKPVRFLNGSLFAEQAGDEFDLQDADYFGHGEDAGLWTIFKRHGWTTQEEDAEAREQSIDPKMLGLLFEQLIAAVEQGDSKQLMERMPDGTYYTPVDVVWEMAKEAVAERLLQEPLPDGWREADMRRLFDDASRDLPAKGRAAMTRRLAGLTFFDPSVGSGEFVLGCVRAVRRGLLALKRTAADPDEAHVRRIVENQMFAQDINPLAVAVARLRLFMAIEEAEGGQDGERPLPNLEAKIVCADTIGTEIRAAGQAQLADSDADLQRRIVECQVLQDDFMRAHQPRRKQTIRDKRRKAGQALADALALAGNTDGSLHAFALHDYLNHDNEQPVAADPRWTFGRARDGFDVVIGNPPYVRPTAKNMGADKVAALKAQAKRNGYHAFDDIYALFCEAALELTKPNGVVSLVVPLSLSFAAAKAHLRERYMAKCSQIALRHQDNGPDQTFGTSPVQNATNRQRTTIITAVRGSGVRELLTSGLGRVDNWGRWL